MKYVVTLSINLSGDKKDVSSRPCETIEEALEIFPAHGSNSRTDAVRSEPAFNCLSITERDKIVAVYTKAMNTKTNSVEWVVRSLNDKEFAANEALVKSALSDIEKQVREAVTEAQLDKLHERLQTEVKTDIDDLARANSQYDTADFHKTRRHLADRCGKRIAEIRRQTGT